jgi:hypothetical protein
MKFQKRFLALFLAAMAMMHAIPAANAENGDSVLTGIGHSHTDTVPLSGNSRAVTLTVPYDYAGVHVNLMNGLIIEWDHTLYKSVVASPEDSPAEVDGPAVQVTVTYHRTGDADDAEKRQTVYSVRVQKAAMTPAAYAGVITKSIAYPDADTIAFSEDDFTQLYRQNDGEAFGSIAINGSNPSFGTLQFNGANYAFGTALNPEAVEGPGGLFFLAAGTGTVSYDVEAYDTAGSLIGTAVLTITVYRAPDILRSISQTAYIGGTHSFTSSDFTGSCRLYDMPLLSVEITPAPTACGTWNWGGAVLTDTTVIEADRLDELTFEGTASGTAAFTWRASNAAGFSAAGAGTVQVLSPVITLRSFSASSLARGSVWTISASDFAYSPPSVPIRYIKILSIPSAADGHLYLTNAVPANTAAGYPALKANTALAAGAVIPYSAIQYLRIATKSTGTAAAISFTWTAAADGAVPSAVWADAASYTVQFVSGGTVLYETYANVPVALRAADFSAAFSAASGASLSHVVFTLPAKTSGTLYYNYSLVTKSGTGVTASAKYYTGTSPNISFLTFVPAADYTGTVSIDYKAYDPAGNFYTGTLTVHVSSAQGGIVVYTADKNGDIQLDAADFSDAFMNATGMALSSVKFTLPSTSYGRLYYGESPFAGPRTALSASEKYGVYSSPYLSYVSFVPREDYTGSVVMNFTGYSKGGAGYAGKLVVLVVDSPAGIVSYSARAGETVRLSGTDFAEEFISVTGSVLSHVQFAPPPKDKGALLVGYSSETGKGTAVTTSTKYYVGSAPAISDIVFVPPANFVGDAETGFTAWTAGGASYAGKLKFRFGAEAVDSGGGTVVYETHVNTPVTFDPGAFNAAFSEATGSALSYVTFTQPDASFGTLYYRYTGASQYSAKVTPAVKYYRNSTPLISDVTFVPSAGFSGPVILSYTGYSAGGYDFTGSVIIRVTPVFSDLSPGYTWAGAAVSYLYGRGIVNGTGNGRFNPGGNMSRGDFMLMVCRAFELGASGSGNFSDVPAGSYYYGAIAAAKALGIAQGSGGKFYPDSPISRQDAMVLLHRALVILGKSPTAGSAGDLAVFSDAAEISHYAADACAALVRAGVITGSGGALRPKDMLSRAETAVMLYRVLTR